jgi:Transposase DDE domain
MARSILRAVQRIKSQVAHWLTPEAIQNECQAVGHTWRERLLDPVTTVHLFLLQILHGNTACAHVPRLGEVSCTGEAYGQARARLPLAVLQRLLRGVTNRLRDTTSPDGRWRGHRTILIDGTSVSTPDTPELQTAFGQPGNQAPGCGFPVVNLLAMFHAATGLLIHAATAPLRTHDMSRVGHAHPELAAGDVLVGDRAFCSFAHLALLAARQVFGVFRVHQRQIVNFRPHRKKATGKTRKSGQKGLPSSRWLKRLGRYDQLVEYYKPQTRPVWLTVEAYAALPATLIVRELRYTLRDRGYRTRVLTLATTLLDPVAYPAAEVTDLYGQRWQIETHFRHLKQTLKMDVLRCKTVEGVEKELTMYALVYNLVRLVMLEAAHRQKVPIDRISFIDAVRWLAESVTSEAPLRLRINPDRPGRAEPRVKKRRPKQFDLMNQPRDVLRKRLRRKASAA